MTSAHINVIDKDGYVRQIHSVKEVTRFRPTNEMLYKARNLVAEKYPEYQSAVLILMHYDKDGYNDKCNYVELWNNYQSKK